VRRVQERVQKVESLFPMANKIAGQRIEAQRSPSAEDLRRSFETAVCEIYRADLAAKKNPGYRSPIFQRGTVLGATRESMEKRALSDAARALAQLWKV